MAIAPARPPARRPLSRSSATPQCHSRRRREGTQTAADSFMWSTLLLEDGPPAISLYAYQTQLRGSLVSKKSFRPPNMDAILVHVALMNIKAVGKERRAGLMRSSDQGSFGAISRRQTSKAIPRSWRARDGTYHHGRRLQLDFPS